MLRHPTEQPSDIQLEAEEDLYQSPTREIIMLKGSLKTVLLTKNRMFQSYVNEFCGMLGLASNTLKFQIEKREINPNKIMNSSCLIKVAHTPEFHNAPNNSLKPALRSVLENGFCSDLKLIVQSKIINAHKCILTVRSPKFAVLITPTIKEIQIPNGNLKIFQKLLVWLYSGELDVPDDITDTIELYYLAQEYEVRDLMWRCEEEIILKISPRNVVDVLVRYFPKFNKDMAEEAKVLQEEDQNPLTVLSSVTNEDLNIQNSPTQNESLPQADLIQDQTHFKAELSLIILNTCKSVFVREFQDVLTSNPDLEQQLASVQGLIIALFSHINEVKNKKKKNKVRFSFVEEIHTPISFDHHFDNTDTHSENSIRI